MSANNYLRGRVLFALVCLTVQVNVGVAVLYPLVAMVALANFIVAVCAAAIKAFGAGRKSQNKHGDKHKQKFHTNRNAAEKELVAWE